MILEALMSITTNIALMFKQGGIMTYIIALIGIYGLIASLEKVYYLKKISKEDPNELLDMVDNTMETGGSIEAIKELSKYNSPSSKIISEGLKIGYRTQNEVEESMERVFIHEYSKITKRLDTLKTIIELSPFLGLVGTVVGIWFTFKSLGMGADAAGMAEGIYIALITTILGLAVVVILLPLYSYINMLIDKELDKIELSNKMTNWNYGTMHVQVDCCVEEAIIALQEADGIISVKPVENAPQNIILSFKPSMIEHSINTLLLEKCGARAEIIESKLKI